MLKLYGTYTYLGISCHYKYVFLSRVLYVGFVPTRKPFSDHMTFDLVLSVVSVKNKSCFSLRLSNPTTSIFYIYSTYLCSNTIIFNQLKNNKWLGRWHVYLMSVNITYLLTIYTLRTMNANTFHTTFVTITMCMLNYSLKSIGLTGWRIVFHII